MTGASGLLGLKLVGVALMKGHEVYAGQNEHSCPIGKPTKMNLLNDELCKRAMEDIRPEGVIHAAALTDVDLCELDKEKAWMINVNGTEKIARLCKRVNSFFIFISTDYVFDGKKGLYREYDQPSPINFYGYTKLKAEEAVMKILQHNYCIIRTSVIFGANPATGKTNFALWVLKSLKEGKEIRVVYDHVNSPTLNSNLAEMVLEIVERRLTGIYHLAGTTPINRYEFATLLAKEFRLNQRLIKPIKSEDINWKAKRPKNSSLNVNKALNELNNRPIDIWEAIKRLKKELTQHLDKVL